MNHIKMLIGGDSVHIMMVPVTLIIMNHPRFVLVHHQLFVYHVIVLLPVTTFLVLDVDLIQQMYQFISVMMMINHGLSYRT
jgi:hypothetical protein